MNRDMHTRRIAGLRELAADPFADRFARVAARRMIIHLETARPLGDIDLTPIDPGGSPLEVTGGDGPRLTDELTPLLGVLEPRVTDTAKRPRLRLVTDEDAP